MKYRKIISFALTGAILLSTFSEGIPAAAAPNKGLILTNVEDGATVASVIRGDSISIKVDNKNNHIIKPGEQGLKVTADTGSVENTTDFTATIDTTSFKTDTFKLLAKRPASHPTPDTGDPSGLYRVYANYYANIDEAGTKQTSKTSQNQVGTFKTGITFPVGSQSTARLKRTMTGYKFAYFVDDTPTADEIKAAGIFNDWVQGDVSIVSETVNGSPTVPYTAKLQFLTKDGKRILADFAPGSYYYVDRKDGDGNIVNDPAGNPIKDRVYGVELDTSFDITFYYDTTSYVGLSVLNQLDVLKDVSSRGAEKDSVFLKFTNPEDEPMYITKDVVLTGRFKIYGRDVELSWWYQMKDDTDRTPILGDQTKKTFSIKRDITDKDGKLIVRATYVEPGFFDITDPGILKSVETEIPIRIKGTGVSTKTELDASTTGQEPKKTYPSDARTIPNQFIMDVYTGTVTGYDKPKDPYTADILIIQGTGNAHPTNILITSSDTEVVTPILTGTGTPVNNFAFNVPFVNDSNRTAPPNLKLQLNASKVGTTKLTFKYMIDGNKGKLVEDTGATKTMLITVKDSSPDEIADLSNFELKIDGAGDPTPFGFTPKKYDYEEILLPYSTKSVAFKPTAYVSAGKHMSIKVEKMDDQGLYVPIGNDAVWKAPEKEWEDDPTLASKVLSDSIFNNDSSKIDFMVSDTISVPADFVDKRIKITLKVRAQSPSIVNTYTFLLRKAPASDDAKLKSLQLLDVNGKDHMKDFVPTTNEYEVRIPYSVKWLKPVEVVNQKGAKVTYSPARVDKDTGILALIRAVTGGEGQWISTPTGDDPTIKPEEVKQTIEVLPENERSTDKREYKLNIIHDAPSSIATLKNITVTDVLDVVQPFKKPFATALKEYELDLVYTKDKVKLLAEPTDPNAVMQLWTAKDGTGTQIGANLSATLTRTVEIAKPTEEELPQILYIKVIAEDGTIDWYEIHVFRKPANKEVTLSSLKMLDKAGVEVKYDFVSEEISYTVTVPYATDKVTLTPVPTYAGVKSIKVNGRNTPPGEPSPLNNLDYPGTTKLEVVVTAEDEVTTGIYTLTVTRSAPSNDARLKDLTVGGGDPLKPVFVPKNTNYTSVVVKDGKTVTVTPTANDPFAKIKVDDKTVESGKASEPITLLAATQNVKIEVTAQDGKAKMNYVITFQNDNMVEKTSNADLRNLTINYGVMTPKFQPSTTTYEVSATEETYSVDIIPVLADRLATFKVFAGTKEIGDYRGNYSQSITDGENEFSVEVISPDTKKTKTYTVSAFRNEEDKMGILTPISPDEIDYTKDNVIVVDITKYTRISADVFNELKKYPEKTIIFEGNDYSLQFAAKDLTKVIPSTTIYDFAMSFTSPEEQDIYDLIDYRKGNEYMRTVLIYFTHHGQLPAPAQLNISLGRRYGNRRQYWNYYNSERDRIDYYGYVDTNSRGTFTVDIDHFSTYVVSSDKIIGAENKSASDNQSEQNLSKTTGGKKVNPGTGISEGWS